MNINSSAEMNEFLAQVQIKYPAGAMNSEQMAKSRVGDVLYDKIFGPYTRKQWAREPSELAPEVAGRIPVRNDFDNRYFADRYQAMPRAGYTGLVERMLQVSVAHL